ncbi:MAG: hypothetical protein ACKO9I_13860 [Sphaerospermopsis kisseleviana]|nr:hypothetical protein [Sphaerospermopsis reniformis]
MFNKLNISKVVVISPQSPVPSPQSPMWTVSQHGFQFPSNIHRIT